MYVFVNEASFSKLKVGPVTNTAITLQGADSIIAADAVGILLFTNIFNIRRNCAVHELEKRLYMSLGSVAPSGRPLFSN